MNSSFAWLAFFLLFLLQGYAQEADPARIIIFRNTGAVKSALAAQVISGDSLWCQLRNQQAWTRLLPPATYRLRSDVKGEHSGKQISLEMEAGKLYLLEVKLIQTRKGALPSSGYGFQLSLIEPRRYPRLLKQKWLKNAISEALWEEMERDFLRD